MTAKIIIFKQKPVAKKRLFYWKGKVIALPKKAV